MFLYLWYLMNKKEKNLDTKKTDLYQRANKKDTHIY
jgi:hypothetical protein